MSYRIGKADIRELTIKSNVSKSPTSIAYIFTAISFYEDIFANHLSCNISVVDGTSLRTTLPLSGGEEVVINVGERHEGDIRELRSKLVLFNISGIQRRNFDVEVYELNTITPEQLLDASLSVNKSYVKPIHEIIRNIVEEYFTPITKKKLIEVEETNGIHSMVATGITPTAFIRQCIREAESLEHPASIYLFYETVEGYHFVTLDKLYAQESKHTVLYDIVTMSEASPGATNTLQNNIRYLNFENNVDLVRGQIMGQFNSRTYSYDPLTKTFEYRDYNYDRDFVESKYVNRTLNREVSARIFENPTTSRFIITNEHRARVDYSVNNDPSNQQIFVRRQNFVDRERAVLQQYASTRLTISIPGNSNIIAGETINVILPAAADSVEESRLNDQLLSGKYIVAAIAHNISNEGEYATVMELLRPGYQERVV